MNGESEKKTRSASKPINVNRKHGTTKPRNHVEVDKVKTSLLDWLYLTSANHGSKLVIYLLFYFIFLPGDHR